MFLNHPKNILNEPFNSPMPWNCFLRTGQFLSHYLSLQPVEYRLNWSLLCSAVATSAPAKVEGRNKMFLSNTFLQKVDLREMLCWIYIIFWKSFNEKTVYVNTYNMTISTCEELFRTSSCCNSSSARGKRRKSHKSSSLSRCGYLMIRFTNKLMIYQIIH